MAESEDDADDNSINKTYKCHPKQKVQIKVCLICENVYHNSDCQRNKNVTYLGNILIICPEHPDLDITSIATNFVLDSTVKTIIAQVKAQTGQQVKQDILKKVSNNTVSSEHGSNNSSLSTNEVPTCALTTEVSLLKQLNSEILDKNMLLKELITTLKSRIQDLESHTNVVQQTVSYANALSSNFTKVKSVPTLIVKAKQDKDKVDTHKSVINKIINDVKLPVDKVSELTNGSVIIKCSSASGSAKMESELIKSLGDKYEVFQEEKSLARLKIVNINNTMDKESLEADINIRNFEGTKLSCTVIHTFPNLNNKKQNAIITVSAEAHSFICNKKDYKLHVGHESCVVYDDLNLNLCFNCGGTGHSAKKCTNPTACLRCAGDHNTKACENVTTVNCINCVNRNNKFNTNLNTNHLPSDTNLCTNLRFVINRKITKTDYNIKPRIPKFLGFNGTKKITNTSEIDLTENRQLTDTQREDNLLRSISTDSLTYAGKHNYTTRVSSAQQPVKPTPASGSTKTQPPPFKNTRSAQQRSNKDQVQEKSAAAKFSTISNDNKK